MDFGKKKATVSFSSSQHHSVVTRFLPLKVETEGAKIAGGLVGVDHGGGRNGDEELVAGP